MDHVSALFPLTVDKVRSLEGKDFSAKQETTRGYQMHRKTTGLHENKSKRVKILE